MRPSAVKRRLLINSTRLQSMTILLLTRTFRMSNLIRAFSTSPSIRDKLRKELIAALKAKDSRRASVLRQLQAEITKMDKAPTGTPKVSESEVIQRCIGRWREAINEYQTLWQSLQSATSAEAFTKREQICRIIESEAAELEIIRSFLPPSYSPEELEEHIERVISELGTQAKPGETMRVLLTHLDVGRVNKTELAGLVKRRLALP